MINVGHSQATAGTAVSPNAVRRGLWSNTEVSRLKRRKGTCDNKRTDARSQAQPFQHLRILSDIEL
jgi:hypothetical protein